MIGNIFDLFSLMFLLLVGSIPFMFNNKINRKTLEQYYVGTKSTKEFELKSRRNVEFIFNHTQIFAIYPF